MSLRGVPVEQRMKTAAAHEHVRGWDWPFYPHDQGPLTEDQIAKRKVMMERAVDETGWLVDGGKRVEYKGSKLEFRCAGRYAATECVVTLHAGEWPPDADLITLADGDNPDKPGCWVDPRDHSKGLRPCHFGGVVKKKPDGKTAEVWVWTD